MFIIKIQMLKGFEWFDGKHLYSMDEAEPFDKEFLMNYTGWENNNPHDPYLFQPYIFDTGEPNPKKIKVNEFCDFDLNEALFEIPRLNRIIVDDVTLNFNGRAYICNGDGKTIERMSDCIMLNKRIVIPKEPEVVKKEEKCCDLDCVCDKCYREK